MFLRWLIIAVASYLIGSLSTGILVSRKKGHDIRAEGSHNTGTSNVLRSVSIGAAALTFAGDFCKAVLAVLIGRWISGHSGALVAGLAVVIGHNWPVFFGFKGGKGIACSAAILLMTYPPQGLIAIGLCLLVIMITRYISLGSLTMLISFTVLLSLRQSFFPVVLWALILTLMAVIRHAGNIRRLINGTESRLTFHRKEHS